MQKSQKGIAESGPSQGVAARVKLTSYFR